MTDADEYDGPPTLPPDDDDPEPIDQLAKALRNSRSKAPPEPDDPPKSIAYGRLPASTFYHLCLTQRSLENKSGFTLSRQAVLALCVDAFMSSTAHATREHDDGFRMRAAAKAREYDRAAGRRYNQPAPEGPRLMDADTGGP